MTDQMRIEWQAWQRVCKALDELGIDINEQDELANAIRSWGDELVLLRAEEAALAQARGG